MTDRLAQLGRVADELEQYIDGRLFDPFGIAMSGIDSHTGRPYERDFITPVKVPRRAAFDTWTYWTYEDAVMQMGLYIHAQVLKHDATGDEACIEKARACWEVLHNVYSCSQIHGIGSFLRPYGGYDEMHKFLEPLGTDQASPMFTGLFHFMKHADAHTREIITDVLLRTLTWYEQQGFSYFYYKSFIHGWEPDHSLSIHACSYYIPAIAWAANVTGEQKWRRYLDARLPKFTEKQYPLPQAFHWGGLPTLREIMRERFDEVFTKDLIDAGHARCGEMLAEYDEPGMTKRFCPESKEPGFEPSVDPNFNAAEGLGFRYFQTRHGGRTRPRHETHFLVALTEMGCDGAFEQAVDLLALRQRVPADFTSMLAEDYEALPETVHLYARSVGIGMVAWWRDYWSLRRTAKARGG